MNLRTLFFCFAFQIALYSTASAQQTQDIAWYLGFFNDKELDNTTAALASSEMRLLDAKETNDLLAQAQEWKVQGLLHLTKTHTYEKALDHFIKALILEDSLHLNYERAITYLAIARVYEEVNDVYKSVESLKKAQLFQEKIIDLNLQTYVLNTYGKMLTQLGKLEEATEQFELVLDILKEMNAPRLQAETLANIATVLALQNNDAKALEFQKQALALRRTIKDKQKEAESLTSIGLLYRHMKNSERSLANHAAALSLCQETKDITGTAASYNHIALLYYESKNLPRAIANLELALSAANEANATFEKMRSFEYLYLCNKQLGDFNAALHYKEEHEGMVDLLQREKDERALAEKESIYELSKLENSIQQLEAVRKQREVEIATQKKVRNILFVILVLSVIILVLILFMYFQKRRSNVLLTVKNSTIENQNLQLQELNATKDKFFSIISHDVKGPLNSLSSFAGLLINHVDKLSTDDIQMLARDLDKSLKNLFALLENLLEWSRSQTGNIEFSPTPFDMTQVLSETSALLATQAAVKNIHLTQKNSTPVLVNAHRNSITTVIRNLLSNAIKFTPEGGSVILEMKVEPKKVVISITDTGVGMSKNVLDKIFRIDTKHSTKGTADEKGTGLGLILCKDFVEKNGGTIGVTSEENKGSTFYFSVPTL